MARNIAVVPDQDLWTVKSDAFDNAMVFRSGAKAEAAARFVCPPAQPPAKTDEA